jgi:hypothetical protein
MAEPNYAAERRLPDGVSCADCRHGARCDGLFGAVRQGFTSCDFWPSRFVPATPPAGDRGQG